MTVDPSSLGKRQRQDRDRWAGRGVRDQRDQGFKVDRRLDQHLTRLQFIERPLQGESTGRTMVPDWEKGNRMRIFRRTSAAHRLWRAFNTASISFQARLRRERSLTTWST